jgi:uncharacterized protein YjbI with pentapeptide repeats
LASERRRPIVSATPHPARPPQPPELSADLPALELAALAAFGFSRLARVTFDDCRLTQTSFLEARLEAVRFHACDLSGADFRGASLRSCEFRGCDLTRLDGVQSLRGAAMEWPDIVGMAGLRAAALGIETLDEE